MYLILSKPQIKHCIILGTYANEATIKKNKELIKTRVRMCTPMFKAALFTTVKRERQLKYLLIFKWINKL